MNERSFRIGLIRTLLLTVLATTLACKQTTPEDARAAREGMPARNPEADSVSTTIDATVPTAAAGDSGWKYAQRLTVDYDGDGSDETAILISDVALDQRGLPMWEDGHRWQLYVQESDGTVTRLYARFVPNGSVIVDVGVPAAGKELFLVLVERSPHRLAVYEYEYRGPLDADVRKRLERDLDTARSFTGSPRP